MPVNGFRVLAHRGARLTSPENTLASLSRAKAEEADAIEFDVRLSSDGEPFIFHDESARRVTGEPRMISSLSWREVRRLRVFGRHEIPHLDDVLRAMEDWPAAELFLDLHQKSLALSEVVARRVKSSRVLERVHVLDFYSNRALLRRVVETAPEVKIAVMPGPPWWSDRSCDLGARSLCLGWDGLLTYALYRMACRVYDTAAAVARSHARGIPVSGGVANTAEDIRFLVGQGIRSIWTDDLALARQVLSERR